ncbi:hypothetical protein CEXT_780821 [Caerostris extrusa]|uniref:BTB domain-containing protein n=1 Tax=Caerostris extrusa TaxID=172846 RepID=A0AAV4XEN3_CAEEX|nr:hypothetical protein CEXT_780821 [Caerostris extrusa]
MSGSMCADSSRQVSWRSDVDYADYTDNDSVYSGSGEAYLPSGPDISQRIRRLITDEVFTDVKFVVNCGVKPKPELRAHKAILAVGSQEFAKMLYSTSMQDPKRSTTSENFEIKNVPFEAFKNVVKYLYTDEVYFENTASVLQTMMAARKFQVHPLVSKCESQLKFSEITEGNACSTLQLAIENKIEPLKDRCSKFIQDNTRDVIRTNGFKTSTLSTVRAICKLPKLNLNSEDELFEAVLEWTKSHTSSQESKRDILLPLLKHIRILSITGMKFTQIVQKCPDIFTAEEAMHVVMYLANPMSSSTANLPSWCNKGQNRCFSVPSVNAAHQIQNFEKKLTISLRPFPRGNSSNLMNVLELKCINGRHKFKALKLVFGDPVTDHSAIGHMLITVTSLRTNYSFKENLIIEKTKEMIVYFTQTMIVSSGETVTIRVEANEIKNYNFLQFDETNHSKDNGPFICNLGSLPKENRLFFISEVIYRSFPPRRRKEPPPNFRGGQQFRWRR